MTSYTHTLILLYNLIEVGPTTFTEPILGLTTLHNRSSRIDPKYLNILYNRNTLQSPLLYLVYLYGFSSLLIPNAFVVDDLIGWSKGQSEKTCDKSAIKFIRAFAAEARFGSGFKEIDSYLYISRDLHFVVLSKYFDHL